ncbi:outer membrane beta-barrel protein [Winogradskyella schleiferi]|uniref:outer membrane beta-barrel protein n=1 Tax=Winogradskyella schleiferi TaxID=2686078 RepID=UPI0015B7DAED|nr:outer membrane beta-barrel protein [Winogradskyella schleiferi]
MKKFSQVFLILITICGSFNSQAQTTDLGVKAGLNLTFFKVNEGIFGEDPNVETGYYIGCFVDFKMTNNLHFQPELLYISLGDFDFLNAPIYIKYNISHNFNILLGPSLNYFFDFFNVKLKIRADLAFAYNLSSSLDLHMKYTLGFEVISPNGIFLGMGYKL